MKNINRMTKPIVNSLVVLMGTMGLALEAGATIDNFNSYAAAPSLAAQGAWDPVSNWYGSALLSTDPGLANGIGLSGSGADGTSGSAQGAVYPVAPSDVDPYGDVTILAAIKVDQSIGHLSRFVLGNAGLANSAIPLNGNRIFLNTGGDATYQVNSSTDTANPKLTAVSFAGLGWVQIRLQVDANGGPQTGGLVGLVTASWRDINDTTGAPLTPLWTSLGSIPQSYGTPSYVGFVTTETATFDNFEMFATVPEPGSLALLALGGGLVMRFHRHSKNQKRSAR